MSISIQVTKEYYNIVSFEMNSSRTYNSYTGFSNAISSYIMEYQDEDGDHDGIYHTLVFRFNINISNSDETKIYRHLTIGRVEGDNRGHVTISIRDPVDDNSWYEVEKRFSFRGIKDGILHLLGELEIDEDLRLMFDANPDIQEYDDDDDEDEDEDEENNIPLAPEAA